MKRSLVIVTLLLGFCILVFADGSDPMPICYVDRNGKVHCLFQAH